MARRLVVAWAPGEKVTARLEVPRDDRSAAILLAHGAGAGQDHPFMVMLRTSLAAAGLTTMSFNYPYTEAGRRAPDRMAKLLAVHRAAADRLSAYCETVYLGGKSMGGRVGSHLAGDQGWPAAGLVYYGYPLVPLGGREPRDTAHLHEIAVGQLFFAGTRDRLGPPDLIKALATNLPAATVEIVEDGDHSFHVPKRAGRTHEEIIAHLAQRTAAWIGRKS
ncbi:MAG: alpha/beta family hydrolase [Acidimicrobiia bacterium]